jgi:alkylhydroperoxidase/carboxymuconolactone decarboxylase family protein YurZ
MGTAGIVGKTELQSPWSELGSMDAAWLEKLLTWHRSAERGALSPKLAALIRLSLNISVTHLNGPNAQRYMRAALVAGASKAELLAVVKLMSVLGIHSYALATPELRAAMAAVGIETPQRSRGPTPVTDALTKAGMMNPDWQDIEAWDGDWLEGFLRMASAVWTDGVLDAKSIELLCVAGDAAVTHLWAPGVRRHAETALRLGATLDELLEVLRIVAGQGIESVELAVPMLDTLCPQNDR